MLFSGYSPRFIRDFFRLVGLVDVWIEKYERLASVNRFRWLLTIRGTIGTGRCYE